MLVYVIIYKEFDEVGMVGVFGSIESLRERLTNLKIAYYDEDEDEFIPKDFTGIGILDIYDLLEDSSYTVYKEELQL